MLVHLGRVRRLRRRLRARLLGQCVPHPVDHDQLGALLGDVVLGLLAAGEVRGDRAQEALRVLIVYTIGFAAFAAQPPLDPGDPPLPGAAELRGNFESGLRWLLAGIIAS